MSGKTFSRLAQIPRYAVLGTGLLVVLAVLGAAKAAAGSHRR
jgi:hypothetical protein